MIDQSSQFMAILTAVGEAKQANADALGMPWTFTQMGVGDANGTDPTAQLGTNPTDQRTPPRAAESGQGRPEKRQCDHC